MKKENLLTFWGWTRQDTSYKGLIKKAPEDWDIFTLNFEELVKSGWVEKLGENVTKFLDENNLERVNIMGHSMGGALALTYTYLHPERVDRLFLLDASGVYGNETLPQLAKNFLKSHSLQGRKKAGENLKAIYRAIRRPIAHIKLARYAHKIDLQEEASSINTPTIIIWGESDHLNPLWQGKRLHALIKNSKLVVLPGMDHDWPLHAPELFWKNIGK